MLLEQTNVNYYKIFAISKLMFYTYVIILNMDDCEGNSIKINKDFR